MSSFLFSNFENGLIFDLYYQTKKPIIMAFFKREPKKFDYKPRYYKGEGNPYELKHKFDEFRTTVGKNKGIKAKFKAAIEEFKNSENGGFNKTILIIIGVLVLAFLWFIDFDLSIFLSKN